MVAIDARVRPADLAGLTVADVVVRHPKLLGRDATVAEARAAFADEHVHMLLVTDGPRLLGTLVRHDLRTSIDDGDRAVDHATLRDRTFAADLPAERAWLLLIAEGQRRRAVVGAQGELVGLLCLKRRLTGFCSDADVAARAAETRDSASR